MRENAPHLKTCNASAKVWNKICFRLSADFHLGCVVASASEYSVTRAVAVRSTGCALGVRCSTGSSLNIVFFSEFSKYSELCFPSVSVCVHKAGR